MSILSNLCIVKRTAESDPELQRRGLVFKYMIILPETIEFNAALHDFRIQAIDPDGGINQKPIMIRLVHLKPMSPAARELFRKLEAA